MMSNGSPHNFVNWTYEIVQTASPGVQYIYSSWGKPYLPTSANDFLGNIHLGKSKRSDLNALKLFFMVYCKNTISLIEVVEIKLC